jgi:hypothetical protein
MWSRFCGQLGVLSLLHKIDSTSLFEDDDENECEKENRKKPSRAPIKLF